MINPYNFVRSDNPMPRAKPTGHDRLQGHSGVIRCRLETITPIFTPAFAFRPEGALADLRFFRIDNRPALPGSSLKGMLRSLAEAICNGCSPFDNRIHPPCRSTGTLCPVCRLFGYLKGNQVHAGRINVSDALAEDGYQFGPLVTLKELSSPKPRHPAFYEQAAREHGRKFYYHQQHVHTADDIPTESRPTHRNVRIEPLLHGVFFFTVHYGSIGETELGLLLNTLELPPNLFHKFGMAKPLGLGTVRIDLVGWREVYPVPNDPKSRYRTFYTQVVDISLQDLEGRVLNEARQHLRDCIEPLKRTYARQYAQVLGYQPPADDLWVLPARNIQDLRIMLAQVPYSREIRYPNYNWFRRHGQEQLPTTQEIDQGQRLPDN